MVQLPAVRSTKEANQMARNGPLSREQRAFNAAQTLHSARLEGHSVTPETQQDTGDYVAGEISSQELLRRVNARYPRQMTAEQATVRLIEIDKGQQLAGHFPSDEALDRARRILVGDTTADEARAEILAKYADTLDHDD